MENNAEDINKNQRGAISKTPRSSNLELYRIVCMLVIVAHHYVVNSGVGSIEGPLLSNPDSYNTIFLRFFGAFGKTGINCFLMITGYYMCTSQITLRKFVKLFAEILFYNVLIFFVFLLAGYETLSLKRLVPVIIPFWGFNDEFVNCFLAFYLTIPFLNILINHMKEYQHRLLLVLLLFCYTILGSIPFFLISFNYITWFVIIYLISSYIRLYPHPLFYKKSLWCYITMLLFLLSFVSIVILLKLRIASYLFHTDCNKFFPVAIAVSMFLWFKNMNIKYNKYINAIGASTFGVLLIHANSSAMRTWLWKDTVDVVGHYGLPLGKLVLYSSIVVLVVFIVCNLIDQLRIATLEKWFFNFYDRKLTANFDKFIKRIINK